MAKKLSFTADGMVTPRPDKPDKIVPDRARPKNCWFYLASWTRSLQETSRKLTRLCQTAPEFPFVYKKDRIWCCLAQSGQLPSSFLQTSGPGSQIEPAIFWSCSVRDDCVWLVWPWCNHTIIFLCDLTLLIFESSGLSTINRDVINF